MTFVGILEYHEYVILMLVMRLLILCRNVPLYMIVLGFGALSDKGKSEYPPPIIILNWCQATRCGVALNVTAHQVG